MKKILSIIVLTAFVIAVQGQALLHKAVVDGRVDSVRMAINLPQQYTGQGVIIGVTDWGFDYTHPVFYDTNMVHYRVLRAWDQFRTSGPAPAGYDYGTELVGPEELLNAKCDTSNVYDSAYHGTHCACIAGGGGAGTQYRGVAVDAEFLFVSVSLSDQEVIDAWRWMYDVAQQEGKRLVVSMSWGLYWLDNMDGTGPLAEEMQRLTDLGVVFVTSAGNNGDENDHIMHTFTQQDTVRTLFSFPHSSIGSSITMMGTPDYPFAFSLFAMDNSYNIVAETPFFSTNDDGIYENWLVINGDSVYYTFLADSANIYNNRPQVQLDVAKQSGYKFGLAVAAAGGDFHAWNMALIETKYGNWGGSFTRPSANPDWADVDALYGISTPGNIDCAITVAAHASRYLAPSGMMNGGSIASFSSSGPSLSQTSKPDISAPGKNVISAISSYTNTYSGSYQTSVQFNGRTYRFAPLSGTSMSCPFVAGVAALVLQANPNLTAAQVKEILLETAYEDQYTEISGELRFGHGKVNAYQAIFKALTTVGVDDFASPKESLFTVYPNPAADHCFVTANTDNPVTLCQIIDLSGRTVLQTTLTPGVNSLSLNGLTPGYYLMKITDEKTVVTKKLVIGR
jgi:subtilisin family serine protease